MGSFNTGRAGQDDVTDCALSCSQRGVGTTSSSGEAAELVQQWPALSSLRGWHHSFHAQSGSYSDVGPMAQAAAPAQGRRTVVIEMDNEEDGDPMNNMTPKEVVEHLDKNIVGQVGCC